MRWVFGLLGVLGTLLGGLWLLQGTGLIVIDPIACVGECTALEGPSPPWALAGAALLAAGLVALWRAIRGRH